MISRQCAPGRVCPCIFEYIYLARPDSVLNDISVYNFQRALGRRLAERVRYSCAESQPSTCTAASGPSPLQICMAAGATACLACIACFGPLDCHQHTCLRGRNRGIIRAGLARDAGMDQSADLRRTPVLLLLSRSGSAHLAQNPVQDWPGLRPSAEASHDLLGSC